MTKENYQINFYSFSNKLYRALWSLFYFLFFRYSPSPFFKYRTYILRLWQAEVSSDIRVYPSAKIWSPKNLTMKSGSSIGPRALIYNQGHITIGEDSIVSQDVTICASSHDYKKYHHPLILKDVVIGSRVWLCAESFVGPGVVVGDGVVLGARAVAKKNLEAWYVYDGNPSQKIKERGLKDE
nr:putative colanic acid biosynthesis acetyltransferase [Serratia fonticola]